MFKKFFRSVFVSCVAVVVFFCLVGAGYVGGYLPKQVRIEEVEKVIEVHKPAPSIKELLEQIPPAYGVSPVLAAAMVSQESGGKMDAIRYEPGQMSRAAKFSKNPEQQRMLSSSHCALQIMGYNAARLGISWSDLYDPETCFEAGMTIVKECLDRHKTKSKYEQLRGALTCYNGSERYADAILGRISRALIEQNL